MLNNIFTADFYSNTKILKFESNFRRIVKIKKRKIKYQMSLLLIERAKNNQKNKYILIIANPCLTQLNEFTEDAVDLIREYSNFDTYQEEFNINDFKELHEFYDIKDYTIENVYENLKSILQNQNDWSIYQNKNKLILRYLIHEVSISIILSNTQEFVIFNNLKIENKIIDFNPFLDCLDNKIIYLNNEDINVDINNFMQKFLLHYNYLTYNNLINNLPNRKCITPYKISKNSKINLENYNLISENENNHISNIEHEFNQELLKLMENNNVIISENKKQSLSPKCILQCNNSNIDKYPFVKNSAKLSEISNKKITNIKISEKNRDNILQKKSCDKNSITTVKLNKKNLKSNNNNVDSFIKGKNASINKTINDCSSKAKISKSKTPIKTFTVEKNEKRINFEQNLNQIEKIMIKLMTIPLADQSNYKSKNKNQSKLSDEKIYKDPSELMKNELLGNKTRRVNYPDTLLLNSDSYCNFKRKKLKHNDDLKSYTPNKSSSHIKYTKNYTDNLSQRSEIIENEKDFLFLKNIISKDKKFFLKLLYKLSLENNNLKMDNIESLKKNIIDKNKIIILIKTKNNNKFGIYFTEPLFTENSKKSLCFEKKCSLFSFDTEKVYHNLNDNFSRFIQTSKNHIVELFNRGIIAIDNFLTNELILKECESFGIKNIKKEFMLKGKYDYIDVIEVYQFKNNI